MKKMLLLPLLLILALPAPLLADGRTEYNVTCAPCHGLKGEAQAETAKALHVELKKIDLKASTVDKAEVKGLIENGRSAMPAYSGAFSPKQIDAIADYVMSLRKGAKK